MQKKIKNSLTIVALLWFFISASPALAVMATADGICFDPQIDIPGMEKAFTEKCSDTSYLINSQSIANYILVIFEYFLAILGILAAIMMMIGGMIWLTAGGNSQKVTEGQSYITSSIAGLLLTIFSITILATINPDLTVFKTTTIQTIKEPEATGPMFSLLGNAEASMLSASKGVTDTYDDIKPGDINTVAKNMVGKFTYSMDKRGKVFVVEDKKTKTSQQIRYIDCSSFACTLLKKSGYKNIPPADKCWTGDIFEGVQPSENDLTKVEEGTLVGWPEHDGITGHVWVSLGKGKFAESHGGEGKNPGKSVQIVDAAYVRKTMREKGKITKPYVTKKYSK